MCDIIYPCGGDTKASTSFTSNFNNLTEQTSTFIKANSTETASSVMAVNTARIDVGGDIGEKCELNLDQSITITSETSGNVQQNKMDDLRSLISSGMSNAIQQAASGTSSAGGAGAQSQDNVTINNTVQSIVSTTVSDTNYSKLVSDTLAKNDGTIRIRGNCNGKVTIRQGIVADIIANNVLNQVAQDLMQNSAIANVVNTSQQTSTATSKGFAEMIDSFFKGLGNLLPWGGDNPLKAGMFFCACVCCVLIIAVVGLPMLLGSGGKST
jgi:hypothetical protein